MGRRFAGYFERPADACSLGRVMDDPDPSMSRARSRESRACPIMSSRWIPGGITPVITEPERMTIHFKNTRKSGFACITLLSCALRKPRCKNKSKTFCHHEARQNRQHKRRQKQCVSVRHWAGSCSEHDLTSDKVSTYTDRCIANQ